jgi:hypothetical protein
MTKHNTEISAGEIIVLTSGEYSDYGIVGYIVAKINFDIKEAIDLFKQETKDYSECGYINDAHNRFIAWLVITERAVPVEYRELHIGSYCELEIA